MFLSQRNLLFNEKEYTSLISSFMAYAYMCLLNIKKKLF